MSKKIKELTKKVKADDVDSLFELAQRYYWGVEVTKDEKKGMKLFQRAADREHKEAQYLYALMLEKEGRMEDAVVMYERASANGHQEALVRMAMWKESGLNGFVKNEKAAAKLYKEAYLSSGDSLAGYHLAFMLAGGLGVRQNEKRAAEIYYVLASDGYKDALIEFRRMSHNLENDDTERKKNDERMKELVIKAEKGEIRKYANPPMAEAKSLLADIGAGVRESIEHQSFKRIHDQCEENINRVLTNFKTQFDAMEDLSPAAKTAITTLFESLERKRDDYLRDINDHSYNSDVFKRDCKINVLHAEEQLANDRSLTESLGVFFKKLIDDLCKAIGVSVSFDYTSKSLQSFKQLPDLKGMLSDIKNPDKSEPDESDDRPVMK